ncbi:MAG: EAL domain-containing protein [Oscillospiraceae bacterium]|nr:EAL domain-containing protein [Oscillospiraceae bacterium]
MPIQMQCCGLILMAILFYFYKSQKTIKLNTGRAFWRSFCMTFICIVSDILSCIVIVEQDRLPLVVVELVSKTYLVTLAGVTYFALLYICTDIYSTKSAYNRIMLRYGIFVAVAVILIYALPIHFYCDMSERVLYSYGASDYATYAFALTTIVIVSVRVIREKSKISGNRRMAVLTWLGVWVLAALVQFFNPKLLLVGFASALGMLVLYLKLENPGFNLDRQTGLFNHETFMQYANEYYATDRAFALLGISVPEGSFGTMRSELEEEFITEAAAYVMSLPNAIAFRNKSTEVLMLYPDMEKAEAGVKEIRRRFEKGWGKNAGIIVSPNWVYVSNSQVADNAEELLYLMRYIVRGSKRYAENRFFEVTSELAQELRSERETERLIMDALENDRVEVWFQPIFSTEEHMFTSAEALVRIRKEDGTLVPPAVFIEIAERNGMILQLGEVVFRKACAFLAKSGIQQYGIKYIEVNLSVVQCAYNQLANDYIKIMEENGISPSLINLEITESASMDARKTLLDNMNRLIDYGVTFSLDDFGTGQSNLNYIIDMPVEIVKFDKGMTTAYFENDKATYIMDAAMNMIRGMDLKIVAEGVETAEQFYMLESLGINYIQGYYFSKPLPADEFLKFVIGANQKTY